MALKRDDDKEERIRKLEQAMWKIYGGAGYALNSLFTTDIAGTVRGAAWDIGAYEFAEGEGVGPEDPPAAVPGNATALRVNVGRLFVR